MHIENDWVITDNLTLTDAAKFILHAPDPASDIWKIQYVSWINFLEGAVLHGKMLADNYIFQHQKDIQCLKSFFPEYIEGVELGSDRNIMKTNVRKTLQGRKDSDSPKEWSDLHRGLFYLNVAKRYGLSYRPAYESNKCIF